MTDPVDLKLIEEWLELDATRYPSDWVHYDDTSPARKPGHHEIAGLGRTIAGSYYDDWQASHDFAFIAASSRIAPSIRALLSERQAREAEISSLKAQVAFLKAQVAFLIEKAFD